MLAWEVDGDIDVDIAACARSVARDLAAHGIDVVTSGESQLRVDLAVDVRNLNTVGTLTFAFLDLSVHVWNDAGSLSRIHALGLKGAGPTTAEAVRAAFLKSTDHLHEAAADARRRLLIPSPHPNGGQLSAPSHELTSRVNRRTEP